MKSKIISALIALALVGMAVGTAAAATELYHDETVSVNDDTQEVRVSVNGTANATVSMIGIDSNANETVVTDNATMSLESGDVYTYSEPADPTTYSDYRAEVYVDTANETVNSVSVDKLEYVSAGGGFALGGMSQTMLAMVGLLVVGVGGFLYTTRNDGGF